MTAARTALIDRTPSYGDLRPETQTDAGQTLHVRVIYTTPEGTLAALNAASDLATDLQARITLVVAEAVPMHFSLDRPHVPVDFLERRNWQLISSAALVDQEVDVKICLCRNPKQVLKQLLGSRSLIVIGGHNNWWNRAERKLATWLDAIGHHVIFVCCPDHEVAVRKKYPGRQEAFLRTLDASEFRGRGV